MPRPLWSGQLSISLVSFGIKLFPAANPGGEIRFHQLDRETGKRVHLQSVVNGGTVIDRSQIVKGFEYKKGKYVEIEPQEIARLRIKSARAIEIAQFADLSQLPLELFDRAYFVVPEEESNAAAFATIRAALEQTSKAAIGKVAFAGREHLVAITAAPGEDARGMMAYTLHFADELRKAEDYFASIPKPSVDKKELALAKTLIGRYSKPFRLASFHDDYEAALRRVIEAKRKKQPLPLEEEKRSPGKVIHLMDALKRSVEQGKQPQPAKRAVAKRGKGGPVLVKPRKNKRSAA